MVIDQSKMQSLSDRLVQDEVKGRSPWADARRRFWKNKAAMTGLTILVLVVIFAIIGVFLLVAAFTANPDNARGVGGALDWILN